jgi:hypothetical protein
MTRIALPTTASLTAFNIDIAPLCHAATLASTRVARHAPFVFCRVHTPSRFAASNLPVSRFSVLVGMTFVFGWVLGLVVVFKLWHLSNAPRYLMFSGVGYVTLMLAPPLLGFASARATGWLATRGFGGAPLGLLALGVIGAVAGFCCL